MLGPNLPRAYDPVVLTRAGTSIKRKKKVFVVAVVPSKSFFRPEWSSPGEANKGRIIKQSKKGI